MLKATVEILQPSTQTHSFLVRRFEEVVFSAPYHYHPEYELTLILKGNGKRFVGNNMADYTKGDLVLLGPGLPHCWKSEVSDTKEKNSQSVVVQFSADFLGKDFFTKPELRYIDGLFEKSSCGIQFIDEKARTVAKMMKHLSEGQDDFKNLVTLLEIFQELAKSNEYILLNKEANNYYSLSDQERINKVFVYLVETFRDEVSLEKAAETANMSPNAFCKYFKKVTRKTFMETVIDYRLNYATQQLIQTDKPVSDICFQSGFSDISHFYKMFKSKMNLSPLNYRKKFMLTLQQQQKN